MHQRGWSAQEDTGWLSRSRQQGLTSWGLCLPGPPTCRKHDVRVKYPLTRMICCMFYRRYGNGRIATVNVFRHTTSHMFEGYYFYASTVSNRNRRFYWSGWTDQILMNPTQSSGLRSDGEAAWTPASGYATPACGVTDLQNYPRPQLSLGFGSVWEVKHESREGQQETSNWTPTRADFPKSGQSFLDYKVFNLHLLQDF